MNTRRLILRNIFWYKSFYRLIAVAVVVAVAVVIGSLIVGDSVRSTLIKRVEERLGKTETIIFSPYSFLNDSILKTLDYHSALDAESPDKNGGFRVKPAMTTKGVLLANGFASVSGKLIPVVVWGTDDLGIKQGQTKINQALYDEIKSSRTKDIVLRLPAGGMVPLGSMYVIDTYTTSLRLELESVISVEQGGNINLKNEQTIPFNIFVNREELAETMGVPWKINVILSDRIISKEDFVSAWNNACSGLNVSRHSALDAESTATVTSDRVFIQNQVVETLYKNDSTSNRIYSYLANSIHSQLSTLNSQQKNIPYSFITAVDFYEGQSLKPDEIILSDYAARRLNVRLGDTLSVSYFVSHRFKTLIEDSVTLKVSKIVALKDIQADKTLSADFPGLSNVERCTDWNSDLPIDMNMITAEDEDYWAKYKNTPKALVPYTTMAPRWANAFGSATALCIGDTQKLDDLTPEMFGIQLIYPREAGLVAAKTGVDFSSLFLSLGFFIILSAGMLMMVPLSEMLFRRRNELNLLRATGFSGKRIRRLLWYESAPVVFTSSIVGVIIGLVYTSLVLFLLGNVWKGATHTEGFRVYPNLPTIVIGMSVGFIFSLLLLYIRIARTLKMINHREHKGFSQIPAPSVSSLRPLWLKKTPTFIPVFIIFIGLLTVNVFFIKSPVLFVSTGITFLFTGWAWIDYLINRGVSPTKPFDSPKLIWSSLYHTKKQAMLSFITLAAGVFIVFTVGLNRQGFADSSQIRLATGGFSLWCETAVPVYHNLNTEEGRSKLGLRDLPKETQIIQLLKYSADDASCLNLNKVATPNVLGIDTDELKNSDFKITSSLPPVNGAIPAWVDETVLTWSLGKKLGDTIIYRGEKGETVPIRLAGTIQNSIFQGYILIDKTSFSKIWSEISGSEIMLIITPDVAVNETKMLISQALNDYGVRVTTTGERLQLFNSVTDTYLTIFLTLGGLGLLLGIISFVIVVRKNIVARLKEITLYRSLGFDEKRITGLFYKENILIPLCAILIGAVGSLLGIISGFSNVSIRIWMLAIAFSVIFIFCVIFFVKITIKNYLKPTSEKQMIYL